MKCEGSPGSTPQRFVALTTNQFPVKKNEFANVSRAWTSLYGMLTMSWNRLNGMLKMEESTSCVSMLTTGGAATREALGVIATTLAAASAAAAVTREREAACMTLLVLD